MLNLCNDLVNPFPARRAGIKSCHQMSPAQLKFAAQLVNGSSFGNIVSHVADDLLGQGLILVSIGHLLRLADTGSHNETSTLLSP
ncbi:hypothetical protein [Paenibacillus sp. J2TS4]|uniref:hypothetical protein n=1 Tax=Paenibacillus sp. J2TS4 TaxID=2807194 RepID=UPI001BCC95E1|nr:hypothetical protein [Paenibacillus sp. J2TS4]